MIPNVRKGGRVNGLLVYLAGPGKSDEHENPHVVSGDGFVVAWHGAEELDKASALEIGDYLDAPRRTYGTQIQTSVYANDPETGNRVKVGYRDQNTWHCSLSLRADEGPLDEAQWDAIASDFMDEMGFTEASGKAPARWVAVHHGTSSGGNDHIHIAASMVREDGTRWEGRYGDYRNAQATCRELEAKYGLERVEGGIAAHSERGEQRAEREGASKRGQANTAPVELAHRVRSAAVASTSEAEWVRRMRGDGIVVKPHFAKGTSDVVRGYKVALKSQPGRGSSAGKRSPLVFYGGGQLGKDLSLPRVRELYATPSVEQAGSAAAEWQAAFRGQPVAQAQGRETNVLRDEAVDKAAGYLAAYNDRLVQIPASDRVSWANAAREASGALSAWARFDPDNRGELNEAARMLARSAQLPRPGAETPQRDIRASAMGAALVFSTIKHGGKGKIAAAMFMTQLLRTAKAVRDYHAANQQQAAAVALHRDVVARLEAVPLLGYRQSSHSAEAAPDPQIAQAQRVTAAFNPPPGDETAPQRRPTGGDGAAPLPNRLPRRREETRTNDDHSR